MTHDYEIKFNKTRTGFKATCSCGQKLKVVSGCNSAGIVYARCDAEEIYQEHRASVGLAPIVKDDVWLPETAGEAGT